MELQVWKGDWGLPSVDPQCLTVITYCKMCGHDIPVVPYPGGSKYGRNLPILALSQSDEYLETPQNIINFLISHEIDMDEHLSDKSLSEMTAYTALITESLYTALMCSWWLEDENYRNVTSQRYSQLFKFPLSFIKPMERRRYVRCMIMSRYSIHDNIPLAEVSEKVYEASKRCLQIMSTKLADNQYILGNVPSQLDAYLFAHLALIRSSSLATCKVRDHLSKYPNLEDYTVRLHKKYYPKLYRLYVPTDKESLLSSQSLHKIASVAALALIGAVFVMFRSGNDLHINDEPFKPDHVE